MNIAMLMAESAAWGDDAAVGVTAVNGWSNLEKQAALVEGYFGTVVHESLRDSNEPVESVLQIIENDGFICIHMPNSPAVPIAKRALLTPAECASILRHRLLVLNHWMYDLCQASYLGNVEEILNRGSQLIGKSLILFDAAFNLIAFKKVEGDNSPAMQETERRGYASAVTREHQAYYRQLSEVHPEGFEILYPETDRVTPMWSQPINAAGEISRLHVMNITEDDIGTIELAHVVANSLRCAMEHLGKRADTRASDFVRDLLSWHRTEDEAIERASFFGWSCDGPWIALRVEPVTQAFPPVRLRRVANVIQDCLYQTHAAAPDQHGIALIAPSNCIDDHKSALDRICYEQDIVIGSGDPTLTITNLRVSYLQARLACKLSRSAGKAMIRTFESCKLDLAAERLHRAFETYRLAPLALQKMVEYDAAHNTEYERTLRVFLEHDLNKTDTCRELLIHRTTLDYRLTRLCEEFEIDLKDEQARMLLRLSFLAQRRINKPTCRHASQQYIIEAPTRHDTE